MSFSKPNPSDAEDIHSQLMNIVNCTLFILSPAGLTTLKISHPSEQQALCEAVLTQILIPSNDYIAHLCAHRYSIVDGLQSSRTMLFLAKIIKVCPSHEQIMDYVLKLPIFLTIPSLMTFFESDGMNLDTLRSMILTERGWANVGGELLEKRKMVLRLLRNEGFEAIVEQRLKNDINGGEGQNLVKRTVEWNNLLGMNAKSFE
ncbi:hypothetical protein BLNAU_1610 [Blattamonas nauphoetae]|uniref:Uncharacterized protein n=1 Tax=Blattamonas nauphoetae TaxID=2049346 RepID=A0ABQ9YIK8_9EUKA|nr:hypothetical protein BLNAU_1610 [Blattamonas nauphoetae]